MVVCTYAAISTIVTGVMVGLLALNEALPSHGHDAAGMTTSLRNGKQTTLDTVGLFADGAAVRSMDDERRFGRVASRRAPLGRVELGEVSGDARTQYTDVMPSAFTTSWNAVSYTHLTLPTKA